MNFPGESWQSGDVVLDVHGDMYTRADEQSIDEGWPWSLGCHGATAGHAPEGGVNEDHPARPLTLLVRKGKAVSARPAGTPRAVSRSPELLDEARTDPRFSALIAQTEEK